MINPRMEDNENRTDLKDDYLSGCNDEHVEGLLDELLEESKRDSSWNDWVAGDGDIVSCPAVCLFCSTEAYCCGSIFRHMEESHQFNFPKFLNELLIASKLKRDEYSHIRLVNYLRTLKRVPESVESVSSFAILKDDAFLQPVLQDDPLLYDFIEEEVVPNCGDTTLPTPQSSP